MKIRIKGNSIRLRVGRGEVERFEKIGLIEDAVEFGGDIKLTYRLQVSADAEVLSATYTGDGIQIDLPPGLAFDWTSTSRVGISAEQPLDSERTLKILIEKDFACIHQQDQRADDGNADVYPNSLLVGSAR